MNAAMTYRLVLRYCIYFILTIMVFLLLEHRQCTHATIQNENNYISCNIKFFILQDILNSEKVSKYKNGNRKICFISIEDLDSCNISFPNTDVSIVDQKELINNEKNYLPIEVKSIERIGSHIKVVFSLYITYRVFSSDSKRVKSGWGYEYLYDLSDNDQTIKFNSVSNTVMY